MLWCGGGGVGFAASFAGVNSYLGSPNNTDFSNDGEDILIAAWVYRTAGGAGNQGIVAKLNNAVQADYGLLYDKAPTARYRWTVWDGVTATGVSANTFGAPGLNAWHFVVAYYDKAGNEIGISVNGGAFDTAAIAFTPSASTAIFKIGAGAAATELWAGRIDQVAFARPADASNVAVAFRDSLYSGGSGKRFASITGAEIASWTLTEFFELEEASGNRAGAYGGYTLQSVNSVTRGVGIV